MGKVTVYIWRPSYIHSQTGEINISHLANAIRSAEENYIHHVGHAAILIEDDFGSQDYISYWPEQKAIKTTNNLNIEADGIFRDQNYDLNIQGNRKNMVMIEFCSLDVNLIQKSSLYQDFKEHYPDRNYKKWTGILPFSTNENEYSQNCCTIVWNLLLFGGIDKLSPIRSGPINQELRDKYCCDEGQIFYGIFNSFWWRDWFMGPTLTLHLVASAKENELKLFGYNLDLMLLEGELTESEKTLLKAPTLIKTRMRETNTNNGIDKSSFYIYGISDGKDQFTKLDNIEQLNEINFNEMQLFVSPERNKEIYQEIASKNGHTQLIFNEEQSLVTNTINCVIM